MARTAQEHLDALLEERDALVDQLRKPSGYEIDGRSVTRNQVHTRLKELREGEIPAARKEVSGVKGPSKSLFRMRWGV